MDCAWPTPAERAKIAQLNAAVEAAAAALDRGATNLWNTVKQGKTPRQSDLDLATGAIDRAKRSLAGMEQDGVLKCLDQRLVMQLRSACVRAYLSWYGRDPAGWESEWARVWPDVPFLRSGVFVPGGLRIAKSDLNRKQVADDLRIATSLADGAALALEQSNIEWAKANIAKVKETLIDGGATKFVHAARVGAARPAGVDAVTFESLGIVAQRLFDLRPKLETLSKQKPPSGVKTGTLVFDPITVTPVVPPEMPVEVARAPGVLDSIMAWMGAHPMLMAVGVGGVVLLVWRRGS